MSNLSQVFSSNQPVGSSISVITDYNPPSTLNNGQYIKSGQVYNQSDYPLLYNLLGLISTTSWKDTNNIPGASGYIANIAYSPTLKIYAAAINPVYNGAGDFTNFQIYTSTDGLTWTNRLNVALSSLPNYSFFNTSNPPYVSIVWSGYRFMYFIQYYESSFSTYVTYNNNSSDGVTFGNPTIAYANSIKGDIIGRDRTSFVWDGSRDVYVSRNIGVDNNTILSATPTYQIFTYGQYTRIASNGSSLQSKTVAIAVDTGLNVYSNNSLLKYTTDTTTNSWISPTIPINNKSNKILELSDVNYVNSTFVCVGTSFDNYYQDSTITVNTGGDYAVNYINPNPYMIVSKDAVTWNLIDVPFQYKLMSVNYANNMYCFSTTSGQILSTSDFVTWNETGTMTQNTATLGISPTRTLTNYQYYIDGINFGSSTRFLSPINVVGGDKNLLFFNGNIITSSNSTYKKLSSPFYNINTSFLVPDYNSATRNSTALTSNQVDNGRDFGNGITTPANISFYGMGLTTPKVTTYIKAR